MGPRHGLNMAGKWLCENKASPSARAADQARWAAEEAKDAAQEAAAMAEESAFGG